MSGSFFALTDRVTTAGRLAIFTVATSRPERENDFEFPDEYSERKPVQLHAHSAHETITFFFLRLSLPLIPLPSIYLTRRSSVARGTLTLMISSISGTSPLLVPFSWLSSAILRGSSFAMKERRHFCLAAFRDDSRVCRRQRRLPPFLP